METEVLQPTIVQDDDSGEVLCFLWMPRKEFELAAEVRRVRLSIAGIPEELKISSVGIDRVSGAVLLQVDMPRSAKGRITSFAGTCQNLKSCFRRSKWDEGRFMH